MDRQHIAEWFSAWRKPLRSWFRQRCSVPPDEVDDLVQDVFVRLLKYGDSIMEVENPQAYLCRVAANVAHERRERARVRFAHNGEWLDELEFDADEEPTRVIDREQCAARVRSSIDRLTCRQRQMVHLHTHQELTYKQIAEHCGVSHRIVLRDLTRAYEMLRLDLKSTGVHNDT